MGYVRKPSFIPFRAEERRSFSFGRWRRDTSSSLPYSIPFHSLRERQKGMGRCAVVSRLVLSQLPYSPYLSYSHAHSIIQIISDR